MIEQSEFDASEFFSVPLVRLDEAGTEFQNIKCPEPEFQSQKIGITRQFLQDAEHYHLRYTSSRKSEQLVQHYSEIFTALNFRTGHAINILDIGAGSGLNTVIPLSEIFSGSRIVATDLSPNLLAILNKIYSASKNKTRVACVCTDAAKGFLNQDKFDLVVGMSILHHLIDPLTALRNCFRACRPGGMALFLEPFEEGHAIVATMFKQILKFAPSMGGLDAKVEKVLSDMILDWSVRVGRDKSDLKYQHLDDKWLFTKQYFHDLARSVGFERPAFPLNKDEQGKFRRFTETVLLLHSGFPPEALPSWAWDCIETLDSTFSSDLQEELPIEAWVAFKKPTS